MNELQKLYDVLVREGKYTKSFEEFQNQWNDEQYQSKVYEVVHRDGLYTKDRESFNQKYGAQAKQQPAQEDQGLVGNIKSQFLNQQPQQQPQRELPRMPKPGELANIGKEDENATFDSQGNYNPINALPESVRVGAKERMAENKVREEAKKKEALQSDLSAKQKAVESTAQQQADASLLASQSAAEAEALSPLLKNEFLRGVYQQLKDEETLPSFVKDQLSAITPEFIFLGEGSLKKQSLGVEQLGVEEAVVPKMNYMFGPLGFKFEETGAGDYMIVKAPNKEEMEISLNNRSMEKNRLESEKLKNFIASNSAKIPQIEKYAAQYSGSDMRFNSEKQIDTQTKAISIQYDNLNKDAELLSNDIKKVESDLEYLNSAPANERNTPQYLEKKKATEAALLDVNTRRQEIISRNSQIEANKTNLDRAVGKYSAMKAEQGTWSGATVSFIGEGISTALSGLVNLALDFSSVDMTGDASQQRQAAIGKSVSDKVATGNVEEDAKQGGYVVDATIRLNNYNRSKGRDIIPEPKQGQSYKDWYNSLSAEQQNAIRVKIEDDITKRSKEIVLPAVREGIQGAITDPNTSVEWKQLAEEGFWGGAYAGLIKSAPAMLAPGGWAGRTAAFFGQSNDAVNEEMSKNPAFADVPESEKLLVSIPIGIANAVLEEVGLSNMIKNKGFVNSLVLKGLQKAGVNATETTLSKIIKNDVESMVARGALTLAGAGLAEAETGAGQQIAEYAVKDIYNLAKEKEMFDTPDSLKEYVYDVVRSGAQEAVGGFVMGTPSAAAAAFRKQGFKGMSDEQFETFEAIANDEKMQSSFIATLKTKVAAGDMTMAEAKEELNDYRNSVGLYRSIPTDLSTEAKKEAMNLVREKQVIEERIKDKDEALVKKQKDRIAEINVQLNNLSENAVQKQTTSEVPIQSETAVSEEVAGGKPTAESQVTTEKGKEEEVNRINPETGVLEVGLANPPIVTIERETAPAAETATTLTQEEQDRKTELETAITKESGKETVTIGDALVPIEEAQAELDALNAKTSPAAEVTATEEVTPAAETKSVDLSIAEGAVERTTKILEGDGADIAAIDADQELDAAFEAYNELLKTDDGTLKGAAKAKLTKAERKFRKLAEAKGVKDYELIAYKRAKKELAAQTAVETAPAVKEAPIAEAAPVAEEKPTAKLKEEPAKGKSLLTDKVRAQISEIVKEWNKTKKRYLKETGEESEGRIELEVHGFIESDNGLYEDLLDFDSFSGLKNINKDIERIIKNYPNVSRIDFKYPERADGRDWNWITIYEVPAPAAEAAPAPKVEPAPTPTPAPAKEVKVDKQWDEEMQSVSMEIDYHQDKIEQLKEEIEIEKGNTKEGIAEIKEKMAKVRESVTNKETRRNLLEELETELEDFKESQADLIQQYKDDIVQEKADMKKAQKRLDKLIAKKEQATQPEAAPKKPGIISMAEIEKRFPLAAEFIKAQYGNVPEVTSKSSLDVLVEAYDQLMRYKVGAEKRLLQIQDIENLVESLEQSVKKVSKEEFKKQIAASGDFTKAQLKIFNALVDSLQTETMPEYMSDEQAAKYNAGTENFYVASLNRIVSKQAEAFMHEIGHFGFFKILSKEDRLKYYQYMIDSNYGKGKPSLASRMAITVDTLLGRSAEGQEFRFRSNAADNFSEYFAQQFSEWYMNERLFPKEIDTIFSKVAQFFNLFIEKLKSGKYVDQNLSEYFNKISAKIEKDQKKNQKIQEEIGIEETMMNELQDLEDFFGIDPAISPMSMRYDTPLQKMALMYNMTETGFFPRNASEPHINRDFFQFGLKAKRASSGSYYLVNINTGKMVKPLQRPKGGIPPQVSRMSVTPISVKDMAMEDVIDTARENGFSDDTIKALLIKRGYDPKEVDSALTFNVNFASAYTNNNPTKDSPLPQAFRTIDGGVSDGVKLFFDVRNKLIDFAQTTKKKGEKAGKRVRTYAEIRAKAIELLEANPIFQAQTDTKQKELIAAFDKTLNIKRGKLVSAQIADIRKALKERLVGMKDLKKAQLILRNFIRQSLPAVKVPRVFFTLDGLMSPAEGINYYNNLRKQVYDFARTDASGVVGKKILVKDAEKIKEFTIKLLKGTELYKNQSPEVQADMENAIINSQYTKGESHTLDIYSQKEVNKLIDIVSQTDSKNLLAQAEKVFDIITEQRAKIKNGLLKEMLILVNKKATSKKTSSGKVRSNGLDAQGQAFYKSIKPIIVAAIKNDTDAMIEIATELSDVEAIQDALDKESAGEELTTLERDLLDKVYAFDTFADILNMELEEVQDLLDGLKGVRSASIVRLNEKRADRVAQREAMTAAADEQIKKDYKALYDSKGKLKDKNDLNDDRAMIWQSFKDGKVWSALTQWLERYDFFTTKITDFFRKTLAHLGTISNILDKSGTFFTDNVYRPLNRMDEVSKTTYSNEMKNLDDLANSIDGVTKGYRQIRRLIESTGVVKMVINGKTSPKNGDQLLRIYALSLNEVQREKLRKMGYTDQKIEEIKKILGPQAIEFADKLVDYFSNEYYESINEVYSFVNDVNLGYVENYFPTQTLSKSKEQQDAFDENLLNGNFNGIFDAESSPALKERTDMSNPIDLSPSFTNVIESHLQTMERYKAYAEGVKKLNDLFKIQSVNTLLDQTGLKSTMKNLVNNSINPNAGVNETQARFGGIMNKFSGYALAFKLAQIPKQATAILAAYEDYQFLKNRKVPGLDAVMFAFDVAKTLTFARSNFNKFYNTSGNFRDRIIKGVEGDVYGLEAGGRVFKPLSQKANTLGDVKRFIKSSAASPTMVGDIISVYGYMANYNRDIANGMSPEAALEKFNNYNATLQSRRAADKSTLQFSKSGLVRAFSMFGSTGILQMNKVAMAYKNIIRSIRNKQVPSGKDLRALAINLGVANAAFVAASYVFALMKGDDEDKEMVEKKMFEALIGLNLLYQIPLVGTATEEVVNAIKNNANKSETLKDIFGAEFINNLKGEKVMGGDVTNPYSSVFRKIKKYYDDDNTIIENFRPAAELALGMQLDPFIGLYKGATEEFDDEVMYDILGISPSYRPKNASSLENMSKSELKKYKPDEYERLYGPGSEDYDEEQAKKEAKAAERKARKDAMDDYYNYESKDDNKRGGSRIGGRGGSRTGGSRTK